MTKNSPVLIGNRDHHPPVGCRNLVRHVIAGHLLDALFSVNTDKGCLYHGKYHVRHKGDAKPEESRSRIPQARYLRVQKRGKLLKGGLYFQRPWYNSAIFIPVAAVFGTLVMIAISLSPSRVSFLSAIRMRRNSCSFPASSI